MPAARFLLLASLALWVGPCRPDTDGTASTAGSETIRADSPARALDPTPHLRLRWASTNHRPDYRGAAPGTLIEVRLIIESALDDDTRSTSIHWDPAFAAAYTLVESDPPAWRVRLDFEPVPASEPPPEAPHLVVAADGALLVADVVATAEHDTERARASTHYVFERGLLAAAGELLPAETSHPRSVLGLAAGLSVFFMAVLVGGTGASLRRTTQQPDPA